MASPTAVAAPVAKLQLLADALALEFSQSLASAQCCATLKHLLSGIEYLCIAVRNPAGGGIVASANCAVEGPTTLHLHDPQSSAAGLALARGQPLQASLLNGTAAAVVSAWSDVQQMVGQAPGVTHLLCVPFGCVGGDDAAATPEACQLHASSDGSGTGTLLFGFSAAPQLDARRKAALALLAHLLPAPMARLSADTLAFVNFATGSVAQCSCCCPHDSDGEEEAEESPCSQCREDGPDSDGDGAGPSQALGVPHGGSSPSSSTDDVHDGAGPSSGWWAEEPGAAKPKATAAAAMASAAHAQWSRPQGTPSVPRFSKALLAAVEEQGEGIVQQSSLTLAFRCPLMEQEYRRWVAQYHSKMDLLFSVLLMAALLIVCFVRPFRLIDQGPSSLLLGCGMMVPLVISCVGRSLYATWREHIMVAMRLYVVAFVNLVSIRSYQAHLPLERLQQWITFWMLTGAESLCVTSLGFPIRLQLHLPLQFAAMGIAAWNLPSMCSDCYPGSHQASCFQSSAAMAALCGYVLPTVGLHYLEQRSRGIFASLLRSTATHEA